MSTRQQKNLVNSFESAKTFKEKLKWFKKMESCFQESDLGTACYTLAQVLFVNCPKDLEQILYFGKRALRIFITNQDNNIKSFSAFQYGIGTRCTRNHESAFYIAIVCSLLGSASFNLKRYGECLSYLNWANRNFNNLLDHDCSSCCCLITMLRDTQDRLLCVKKAMGLRQDIVVHALKILEIDEKTMDEGCIELGYANRMVSEEYVGAANFEKALPFALKALDIYTKHGVGDDSEELAKLRSTLGNIYAKLGEHDKALELTRLSLNSLKNVDLLCAQMQVGNILLGLGRSEEGIEAFMSLLPLTEIEGNQHVRACSLMGIATGFCNLAKYSDAKKYMKIAQRVFEKKQISPSVVAVSFVDMSGIYEDMKDNESAILCLQRALAIPEIPLHHLMEGSSRLFLLSLKNRKEKKGFSYLEDVVDRLKEKLGPEHIQVGCAYNTLGVSYMRSGQLETAAECFLRAKDVLDVSLGPHHLASTKATPCLTKGNMERIHLAVEIQEKVVENLKGWRPSEKRFLDEAVKLLNRMKESVTESSASVSPQSRVGEDLSAAISKCGIPDYEGKSNDY